MGDLAKWRKQKWVRIGTDGSILGACGTSKNTKNPDRCLPLAKANSLTKLKELQLLRKRREVKKRLFPILRKQELETHD